MLRRLLAENAGHFWWPEEFENPYFNNLKHLQNPGHLSLTAPSMSAPVGFLMGYLELFLSTGFSVLS